MKKMNYIQKKNINVSIIIKISYVNKHLLLQNI